MKLILNDLHFLHLRAHMSIHMSQVHLQLIPLRFTVMSFSMLTVLLGSRYVHVHADPRRSPLRVHDGHGGYDIDQSGCQPAVQRPSPVGVLLLHPHFTHHLAWSGRQDVHLGGGGGIRGYLSTVHLCDVPAGQPSGAAMLTVTEINVKCVEKCFRM